ncbi:FliM/FliN family flagellar motor switch protein [Meridianimarinicoccus sp. RP-17]
MERMRMSDTGATALRRMIGMARRMPAHGAMGVEDALRLALSRAGQDAARVALAGGTVQSAVAPVAGLGALLPQGGLWVVLQGPHRLRGVAGLDANLLSGLVQALTTGRIKPGAVGTRTATQTDALLLRRFLGVLVDALARRLDGQAMDGWATGYQPRDRIADAARLPHLLPDMPYRVLTCAVDMAEGVRSGTLVVALPEATPVAQSENPQAAERAAFSAALGRVVADAPAELEAVLCRLTLQLDTVAGLKPDMVLPLPRHAVAEVVLQGCDGRVAAVARLGQSRGQRAVKLVSLAGAPAAPTEPGALPPAEPALAPVPVVVPAVAR